MTIRTKLTVAFIAMIALTLIVATVDLYYVSRIETSSTEAIEQAVVDPTQRDLVKAKIQEYVEHAQVWNAVATFVVILIIVVLVPKIVRSVYGPINALETEMNRVIEGERTGQLEEEGEFASQARTFNRMVTSLQDAESSLKQNQEQMYQSQKLQAIGTLAGGVAHDFNNILAAILGFAEMTREDLQKQGVQHLDDEIRNRNLEAALSNLDEIVAGSMRAKSLVSQILMFSSIDQVQHAAVEPRQVVTEALNLMRSTIPPNINIDMQLDDNVGQILIDATQLHQVVINLVANGIRAMQPNGGTLSIRMSSLAMNNESWVELTVRDNGVGMAKHVLDRAFEPFFTTRPVGEGTGMGLAVVHGIVLSAHGEIEITSTPGEGTMARILMPTTSLARPDTPSQSAVPSVVSGKLLVVDDDTAVLAVTRKMVERMGYDAVAVDSAEEAMKLIESDPEAFDAVITDETMPSMKGTALAESIGHLRPSLPVIIVSGFVNLPMARESQGGALPNEILTGSGTPFEQSEVMGDSDQLPETGSARGQRSIGEQTQIQGHPKRLFLAKPYRQQALAEALKQVL